MKKKVLTVCLVAVIAIMAVAGASLAYLTDTDEATNTFTLGNVSIELIETTYHREGNDNAGDTQIPDPTAIASGMEYVTDGHKIFTDAEIQANAADYEAYLADRGTNIIPGRNAAKCPYVINTGANDAYIRIRVLVPSAANNDFVQVSEGGVIVNQWCTTSMKSGEFIAGGDYPNDAYSPTIHKGVEIDGIVYDEYVFVRNKALEAGAMTEWNVWNFIGISKDADWDDIQKAIDAGALTKAEDGTISFNVLVQADAIQTEGFADAEAAFDAFDKAQ